MPIAFEHDGSIAALLQELRRTAGIEGVAILDLNQTANPVTYSAGISGLDTIEAGKALLEGKGPGPFHAMGADRRLILACPSTIPPSRPGGVVLWRPPGGRPWTESDHGLAAAVAMLLMRIVTAGIGQIGIDRLTGIPNRRWFIDEADRRIDRLERDETIGTLSLIDIDDLKRLNTHHTRTEGDRVLVRLASQLRGLVRPSDLVARVGDDEFAVWQDGMDHLTAAERAEALCTRSLFSGIQDGHSVTVSVGIASRRPGSGEDIRTLLRRAHMAARDVKTHGGGGWRVSNPEPARRCTDPSE